MCKYKGYKISADYGIVFIICALFIAFAFWIDSPAQVAEGYLKINLSRSVLVTDYIALGGIGAALLNSAISGLMFLFLLIRCRQAPTGIIVASLWTTMGFSLFGKNLFNVLPILLGVWLYAKVNRRRFSEFFVPAMLSATIAPLVSEIAFLSPGFHPVRWAAAYAVGLFVGFIFPVVAETVKHMHKGYCLYNCGTAGGFIATFCVGLLRSVGVQILPENIWDTSHTAFLGAFAYLLSAALIVYGIVADRPAIALAKFKSLLREREPEEGDYLSKYGSACYINIGAMGIAATSAMLLLKIPINGPVLGGIFTVAGFSASGKHLRNALPILLGSIIATDLNYLEQTAPSNCLAMLFSTGLAPIAGKYGWLWGIAAGFLHVSMAIFIGQLNGGLNLYNNGFAGGFVAMIMVPLIIFFKELVGKYQREKVA